MKTADVVLHRPTGETWTVASVEPEKGEFSPCGWPFCWAKIADAEIVREASAEESEKLLRELANGSGSDYRRRWAARELAKRAESVR